MTICRESHAQYWAKQAWDKGMLRLDTVQRGMTASQTPPVTMWSRRARMGTLRRLSTYFKSAPHHVQILELPVTEQPQFPQSLPLPAPAADPGARSPTLAPHFSQNLTPSRKG